jgi:hypothetical protein
MDIALGWMAIRYTLHLIFGNPVLLPGQSVIGLFHETRAPPIPEYLNEDRRFNNLLQNLPKTSIIKFLILQNESLRTR